MSVDFLIPVYNGELYLEQCIKSIKSVGEHNIIIYNDGSIDRSKNIIHKLSKINKNINIIESIKNCGVVHSRFELIKNAISDYIFFLDSDDYLIDSSSICEFSKNNHYDIVQFNRKKIDSQNKISALDIQDLPFLIDKKDKFDFFGKWGKKNNITYSIHNKLIRRSLFHNFPYDELSYPKIYEDILMNIYLISQEPHIMLDNTYTYMYRTQIESITSNPIKLIENSQLLISYITNNFLDVMSDKSLQYLQRNIFEFYILNKIKQQCITKEQASKCYGELFCILARNRKFFSESNYNAIISRIFSHATFIFDIRETTSLAAKADIDIDSAIYNTLKMITDFSKREKRKIIPKAVQNKTIINRMVASYRKIKRSIYSYFYRHKNPYIAVIDYPGRGEVQNYLENRLPLPLICFDSWDTKMSTKVAIENAKLIITSVPYGPLSKLKLKGKVFNCWHGSGAFKRFGKYDSESQSIYGVTDYIICSSEDIRGIYADSMELPLDNVFATGTPRTDIYFNKEEVQKRIEYFYEQYPQFKEKKIYVYLPTYREFRKKRFFTLGFSLKELDILLKEDEIFIIKNHPSIIARILKNKHQKYKYTNIKSYGKIFNLDDIDTETLTMISDVFITDYSSSFFEAMLLDKPLVFYAEDYTSYNRDFYFDYNELPGEKIYTSSPHKLVKAIRRSNLFIDKKIYNDFKKKYIGLCDGNSGERVQDIILQLINN